MTLRPLLSLFPGIDILGRAFEEAGFCVVRGPDLIFGGDIRSFHAPPGAFEGVFGGSPCPDFSKARRSPASGEGMAMLQEFQRVVFECRPDWFLLENVVGVPSVIVEGYKVQRFNLNARECGLRQNRNRCFQFGNRDGTPLVIKRLPPDDMASRFRLSRPCDVSQFNTPRCVTDAASTVGSDYVGPGVTGPRTVTTGQSQRSGESR